MANQQREDRSYQDPTCLEKREKLRLGLVLSGGGALGAYQVGVWKALQECNLTPHIRLIAGTSIGAINGALIAQGASEQLENMWREMKPGNIFQAFQSNVAIEDMGIGDYLRLARELVTRGRIDISPFKTLLNETLDEDRIRSSNIRFALNVWNVLQFKGEQFLIEDIPEGQLADYIIASASFPLFWPHRIDGKYYLDGGIDLNLPIDIPFDRAQLDHVIAVDVAVFMKYRPKQLWRVFQHKENLTIIRPSQNMGSPMHFSKKIAEAQIQMGYEDSLRILKEDPKLRLSH